MQRKEETKSTQTFNEYTKLIEFVLSLFRLSSKIELIYDFNRTILCQKFTMFMHIKFGNGAFSLKTFGGKRYKNISRFVSKNLI